jgi:hypothetical protein
MLAHRLVQVLDPSSTPSALAGRWRLAAALLTVVAASSVAVGCSESVTADVDMGTTITFDAGPDLGAPDFGTDLGPLPPVGTVGAPCATDDDCMGDAACIPPTTFPGGYCAIDCTSTGECPEGSECLQVDRTTSLCLDTCDPGASARQCRPGYGCAPTMTGTAVCLPGCTDDSDCSGGTRCDPSGGLAGSCFDPSAAIGDACVDESQCPMGAFCLAESFAGWPDGMCIVFGCDPTTGAGCPSGGTCIQGRRGGLCVGACMTDGDCRRGYRCADNAAASGGRYCAPVLAARDLGQPCSGGRGSVACAGGTCLREFETGFPGSYCSFTPCTLGATGVDDGCPGDGVCVAGGGGRTYCLDGCTATTDCRRGYECRPIDPSTPDGEKGCMPACASAADCVNDGATCDTSTGLCSPPPSL